MITSRRLARLLSSSHLNMSGSRQRIWLIRVAARTATRSPAFNPEVTATLAPSSGSVVTGRGSKRSGAVFTQTMVWLAGFFISAAAGTRMPGTVLRVCTKTLTGWPTANVASALPSPRKVSGKAWSRRLRATPSSCSGSFCSPTATKADGDIVGDGRIEGQRLDQHPLRIDDLEQGFAGFEHLPGDHVGRRDDAADRRDQLLVGHSRFGFLDHLARHGVGQFAQATQTAFGQRTAVAADLGRHIGQDFALFDRLTGQRQSTRPRGYPAGDDGLHFAAGVRVHDHLAAQFGRLGQFARLDL